LISAMRRGIVPFARFATGASSSGAQTRRQPRSSPAAGLRFGRYCGSGFGTERRRIAAQARAVDRSRASSASPHLAKDDRKPVALSAPGVISGCTRTLFFFGNYGNLETNS
jgi:hypothetical protein